MPDTETAPAKPTGHAAFVGGSPVSPDEAIKAATALIAASRSPVIAGMGTDWAGTRAVIALAETIGASIDHMDAATVFTNLDVMRRSGWVITTPLQACSRADTVLLVGDGITETWPELEQRLRLDLPPTLTGGTRRVFHLCPGIGGVESAQPVDPIRAGAGLSAAATTAQAPDHLLCSLAALRTLAAGRATSLDQAAAAPLRQLAASLAQARFGVAVWSAAALGTLAVEMLCGLIDDLNKTTRFAGLPLAAPNGAEAVIQALTSGTGFPMRTGFADTAPQHDPWRFAAERMIDAGEADAAIWISAFSAIAPPWDDAVPTIALVPKGTALPHAPRVVFEIGCPGRDHDAMLFDQALGGIAFTAASSPQAVASVADTISAITAALPPC